MGGCGRGEERETQLAEEAAEGEIAAAGGYDDEIHEDEHDFVAPSIGAGAAPETGAPDENLFLGGTEHDENQADGGRLGQNAKGDAEAGGKFGRTEKKREGLAHADALAARVRLLEMMEAAGDKDESNHQPKKEKGDIGVRGELREGHASRSSVRERVWRVFAGNSTGA